MSKLFTINKKNNKFLTTTKPVKTNIHKYFPVSTREWNNSIYSFNKNSLSLIPISSKISSKLIKEYFRASNFNIKYKLPNSYLTRKQKRLTGNRIYVSNGEFKHTSNKVIIVLYTYNREKYNYLKKFKNRKILLLNKMRYKLKKKFLNIKTKSTNYLKKIDYNNKYDIIKKIKKENVNVYMINFYKKWMKKCNRLIKKYIYLKQLLYVNSSKYNYTYLQILKNYIEKVQNKKVEFNLINIKYNYLNSDILLKSVTLKITKNRKKHRFYMNLPTWKIKPFKNNKLLEHNYSNININESIENISDTKLKKTVLKNIKYKQVSGIRLQIAGRLNKRIKSSRAMKTVKYKGNLKDNNPIKHISKVILKGNLIPNLQYTKLKSKTRIGSFGIKGWVSGN